MHDTTEAEEKIAQLVFVLKNDLAELLIIHSDLFIFMFAMQEIPNIEYGY